VPFALLLAQVGLALVLLKPAHSRRILFRIGCGRFPRLMKLAESLFLSFDAYRRHPTLIGRILGVSFLFQTLVAVAVYCLSRSLALGVPLVDFLAFVPIVTIMESIPISIYGLGLRDAGYVFFFTQIGLAHAEAHALAMSVLYVVMTAGYAALGGILLITRLVKPAAVPVPVGRGLVVAEGGPPARPAARNGHRSVRDRAVRPESSDPPDGVIAER
jgi:hypothetical protein